ncbi:hypothetical protein [Spongorhabdus nitratireducens]
MRSIEEVIEDVDGYLPVHDDWEPLDELIDEACNASDQRIVKPFLGLLERNQDHDGYGVFWSIVHALESLGGYETELAASALRKPHELSVLMLNRLLNSGIQTIDGRPILEILLEIANNPAFPKSIQEEASEFVAYQREKI